MDMFQRGFRQYFQNLFSLTNKGTFFWLIIGNKNLSKIKQNCGKGFMHFLGVWHMVAKYC